MKTLNTYDEFVNEARSAKPEEVLRSAKFTSKSDNENEFDYEKMWENEFRAAFADIADDLAKALKDDGYDVEVDGKTVKVK